MKLWDIWEATSILSNALGDKNATGEGSNNNNKLILKVESSYKSSDWATDKNDIVQPILFDQEGGVQNETKHETSPGWEECNTDTSKLNNKDAHQKSNDHGNTHKDSLYRVTGIIIGGFVKDPEFDGDSYCETS